jgi:hypothetical protein
LQFRLDPDAFPGSRLPLIAQATVLCRIEKQSKRKGGIHVRSGREQKKKHAKEMRAFHREDIGVRSYIMTLN